MIIKVPHSGFNPLLKWKFEESETCDEQLICFNSQELLVIKTAIQALRWPTRYGEFLSPWRFETYPNQAVIDVIDDIEVKMSCNQISDGLEALGADIRAGLALLASAQCCDNTQVIVNVNGGVNGFLSDGSVTYGSAPYSDFPTEIPDGYDDQNHFDTQLCARANALFDAILQTLLVLTGTASFNAIGATVVLSLTFMGMIAIPEVVIPVLIAAMAVAYLSAGSLYAARQELINYREDIICILISGENYSAVIASLADIFDLIVASLGVSSPVGVAIKTILLVLFSADSLNWILEAFGGVNYPDADCSGCEEELPDIVGEYTWYGTLLECLDSGDYKESGDWVSNVVPWNNNPNSPTDALVCVALAQVSVNLSFSNTFDSTGFSLNCSTTGAFVSRTGGSSDFWDNIAGATGLTINRNGAATAQFGCTISYELVS